jgi:hypothetical protein
MLNVSWDIKSEPAKPQTPLTTPSPPHLTAAGCVMGRILRKMACGCCAGDSIDLYGLNAGGISSGARPWLKPEPIK